VAPAMGWPVALLVILPVNSPVPILVLAKSNTVIDNKVKMHSSFVKIDLNLIRHITLK
jgi:hypothetical protein